MNTQVEVTMIERDYWKDPELVVSEMELCDPKSGLCYDLGIVKEKLYFIIQGILWCDYAFGYKIFIDTEVVF